MFISKICGKFTSFFFEILKFPRFTREISKFQKSELGKFTPNFSLKQAITSTN